MAPSTRASQVANSTRVTELSDPAAVPGHFDPIEQDACRGRHSSGPSGRGCRRLAAGGQGLGDVSAQASEDPPARDGYLRRERGPRAGHRCSPASNDLSEHSAQELRRLSAGYSEL